MQENIKELLSEQLYDMIPSNLVIIDKDYNIIHANNNFIDYFGEYEGKKCYEVYKKKDCPCSHCRLNEVFESGQTIVSNEEGLDKNNRLCYYVVHLSPLKEKDGSINYVVEMSTDLTETTRYQKEYNILFERVPGFVTVIDNNYRIIRANKKFRDTFGDVTGKYCYQVYKKRNSKCKNCPAKLTFEDGKDHVSSETGKSDTGVDTQYVVNTTPLSVHNGSVHLVIEIATDISELVQLHREVRKINDFFATIIQNSHAAIIAINNYGKTEIFNPAAKKLLDWRSFRKPVLNQIKQIMPQEFFNDADTNGVIYHNPEAVIKTLQGKQIPVSMKAVELSSKNDTLGRVVFMQDLRRIKNLEKEKIDAERLAAVGQTVAGLAHSIKNLLMGLEGGMYMVDTGMKNGDAERIMKGWDVLQRNFDKTTTLVKDFLSFSKGRMPELVKVSPNQIVMDIVELYRDSALRQNVILSSMTQPGISEVFLDPSGMEACLTNLVSNAIDAAKTNNPVTGVVEIRTLENDEEIIIEVADNGEGMEMEVRDKIFTTFFTTKGGKGTGLGLLTTRKIISEHGGRIDFETELDLGSVFRIVLNKSRLNTLWLEINSKK